MATLKKRIIGVWDLFIKEVLQFATVGGLAFIVNASVTWTLMSTVMTESHGKAKIIAGIVATLFSWVANRLWTFRDRRTENKMREAIEFALVNALGIAVEFACVVVSYYLLGLTSPTASFISGTIVGTALGTIVRYFMYRFWVFGKGKNAADTTREEEIAQFIEEATEMMTGQLPVVEATSDTYTNNTTERDGRHGNRNLRKLL